MAPKKKATSKIKLIKPKAVPPSEFPFPFGVIEPDRVARLLAPLYPAPFYMEVLTWIAFRERVRLLQIGKLRASVEAQAGIIKDLRETEERIRRMMGGRLPTDGTYDVSFIDGGELSRQINEGLDVCARDIHRRGYIDEPRQVSVTIKAEPSENSAAVKWNYEVTTKLAKSKGGGVAFLDKDGRLQPPNKTTAEQIMMPLDHDEPETPEAA